MLANVYANEIKCLSKQPIQKIKENFMSRNFNATTTVGSEFAENINVIEMRPIQWKELPDIDDVEQINSTDYAVLDELRSILIKHNYTDRFGITLLHKHFDLSENEVLMERTDTEARISILSVEPINDSSQKTIETMWKFGDDITSATKCVQKCEYNKGHRSVHVKVGV